MIPTIARTAPCRRYGPLTWTASYCDRSEADQVRLETDSFPIISEAAQRAMLGILARTVAGRP